MIKSKAADGKGDISKKDATKEALSDALASIPFP